MRLDNATYNKVKLLYKLSEITWFIEKHGQPDAKSAGDTECLEVLMSLQKDVEKYIERFQKELCTITQ